MESVENFDSDYKKRCAYFFTDLKNWIYYKFRQHKCASFNEIFNFNSIFLFVVLLKKAETLESFTI